MDPVFKPQSPDDIDKFISAEIPDKQRHPKLYEAVQKYMAHLSEDILNRQRRIADCEDLILDNDQIKNIALGDIEEMLQSNGRSLRDYPDMPFPMEDVLTNVWERLIVEELNFDRRSLADLLNKLLQTITDEQREAYDKIISKGDIVLNVASSGIASLLVPNGRTAHSRFKIPLIINEDSTCKIKQGSPHTKLLNKAKLIIWDEAPMVSKYCYEALDRCLKDVLRYSPSFNPEKPFGGKVVVLGGDFRQILPVIPKGSREDIVQTTISSSNLWGHCQVLQLTKNMRLTIGSSNLNVNELKDFSDWLLKIGDGLAGESTDGEAEVQIPDEMLIKKSEKALDELIDFAYPQLLKNL
ncbi:hypothetical protein RIF29_16501 [Crotalaria pallida]|uniref:ATP-dependent DNA helicase n=1 Tax=Crotalaria pallida TaxID=3830 RepID=A0AAN9FL68_CROPI